MSVIEGAKKLLGNIWNKQPQKTKLEFRMVKGNSGKPYEIYYNGKIIGAIYKDFKDKEIVGLVDWGDGMRKFSLKKNDFIIKSIPDLMQRIDKQFKTYQKSLPETNGEEIIEEHHISDEEEIPITEPEELSKKEVLQRVEKTVNEVNKKTRKSNKKALSIEV